MDQLVLSCYSLEWSWLVRSPAIECHSLDVCVFGVIIEVVSERSTTTIIGGVTVMVSKHCRASELSCCHFFLDCRTFNLFGFKEVLLCLEQFCPA